MRKLIPFLTLCLYPLSFAENPTRTPPPPKRNIQKPHSIFPPYTPRPSTHHTARPPAPQPNVTHEDHIGNRVTDDHMRRIEFAHQRAETVMKTSPQVHNHVAFHAAAFTGTLHPIYEQKQKVYAEHFDHYHAIVVKNPQVWRDWHHHHFYGGFYYGFHPVPDITIYFYNPIVHWFYIGTWDDAYYRTWYAGEYEAYPALNHPFPYYGAYFPTENLRQLLFGASAMPVDKQAQFRTGMINITQQITQQIANISRQHVVLSNGDILLTHYEILGADDGIELDGAVNSQSKSYNFKGLLELNPTNATQTFVTGGGEVPPTPAEFAQVDDLNREIELLRGNAIPDVTPTPIPLMPSGEVSADPK